MALIGGPASYDALGRLKDGHARFLAGKPAHPNSGPDRVRDTGSRGQRPFAVILTCADSRVVPERIFDQGLGDLVVIRVEGNVCTDNEMASIEGAVGQLEVPLILVLGHTQCGALAAAVTGSELGGHLRSLVEHLKDPVSEARRRDPKAGPRELAAAAVPLNVYASMRALLRESEPVRERLSDGKASILGAVYDVADGRIDWLGSHPDQDRLLSQEAAVKVGGHAQAGKPRPGAKGHGSSGFLLPALTGLLLLSSGVVLGVGLVRRRGAPKPA